jgi:hypothetical protein
MYKSAGGGTWSYLSSGGSSQPFANIEFNTSLQVPTALENRMATIASYYCMKYCRAIDIPAKGMPVG